MLSPARLTELTVEIIFVMLGVLVVWLGLNGRVYFDRHSVQWLVISVGIIAWGLVGLGKPGQWWMRWQKWNRSGSLILLGVIMLAIMRVPFLWVDRLLALSGVVLLVRGILGSFLILKAR